MIGVVAVIAAAGTYGDGEREELLLMTTWIFHVASLGGLVILMGLVYHAVKRQAQPAPPKKRRRR